MTVDIIPVPRRRQWNRTKVLEESQLELTFVQGKEEFLPARPTLKTVLNPQPLMPADSGMADVGSLQSTTFWKQRECRPFAVEEAFPVLLEGWVGQGPGHHHIWEDFQYPQVLQRQLQSKFPRKRNI